MSDAGTNTGIVIPIRSFTNGKGRLAAVLGNDARIALVRQMADTVVAAAGSAPMVVVSTAPEVASWCDERGLERIDDPGSLDGAADAGRSWARGRGYTRVVVVHADLPHASTLTPVIGDGDAPVAVLVPDHRDDGSPVVSVPVAANFQFAYGPGSFERHYYNALAAGLEVRVVRDAGLGFDVDLAEDLDLVLPSRPYGTEPVRNDG